jgi:hypothetical protein
MIGYRMMGLKMNNDSRLRFRFDCAFIVRNLEHVRTIIVNLVGSRCISIIL